MTALVWIGAALAALGGALLVRLVLAARRIRSETLTPEQAQARFAGLIALNFAGLGAAFVGLGLLAAGLLLAP